MSNELIFNHHSLPFKSSIDAVNALPIFLKICIRARISIGLRTILVDDSIDKHWFQIELSKGYYWKDWFNQNKNNDKLKDEIRVFRSIATNSLFRANDIGGNLELFDVQEITTGNSYSALRASAWYSAPLCSFPINTLWKTHPLEVCIETLSDNCEIVKTNKSLINIFSIETWNLVENDLIENRNSTIATGRDLWNQRSILFPNLKFCGKSSAQLQCWSHGKTIFDQIKNSLTILNSYSKKMGNKTVQGYSHKQLKEIGLTHKVSGESEQVYNNPKKRKEREFYLPDGSLVFFENHIKLSNFFRIHFYPSPQDGIIYIAYIGPHLKL